jgi:hypothetical protein
LNDGKNTGYIVLEFERTGPGTYDLPCGVLIPQLRLRQRAASAMTFSSDWQKQRKSREGQAVEPLAESSRHWREQNVRP